MQSKQFIIVVTSFSCCLLLPLTVSGQTEADPILQIDRQSLRNRLEIDSANVRPDFLKRPTDLSGVDYSALPTDQPWSDHFSATLPHLSSLPDFSTLTESAKQNSVREAELMMNHSRQYKRHDLPVVVQQLVLDHLAQQYNDGDTVTFREVPGGGSYWGVPGRVQKFIGSRVDIPNVTQRTFILSVEDGQGEVKGVEVFNPFYQPVEYAKELGREANKVIGRPQFSEDDAASQQVKAVIDTLAATGSLVSPASGRVYSLFEALSRAVGPNSFSTRQRALLAAYNLRRQTTDGLEYGDVTLFEFASKLAALDHSFAIKWYSIEPEVIDGVKLFDQRGLDLTRSIPVRSSREEKSISVERKGQSPFANARNIALRGAPNNPFALGVRSYKSVFQDSLDAHIAKQRETTPDYELTDTDVRLVANATVGGLRYWAEFGAQDYHTQMAYEAAIQGIRIAEVAMLAKDVSTGGWAALAASAATNLFAKDQQLKHRQSQIKAAKAEAAYRRAVMENFRLLRQQLADIHQSLTHQLAESSRVNHRELQRLRLFIRGHHYEVIGRLKRLERSIGLQFAAVDYNLGDAREELRGLRDGILSLREWMRSRFADEDLTRIDAIIELLNDPNYQRPVSELHRIISEADDHPLKDEFNKLMLEVERFQSQGVRSNIFTGDSVEELGYHNAPSKYFQFVSAHGDHRHQGSQVRTLLSGLVAYTPGGNISFTPDLGAPNPSAEDLDEYLAGRRELDPTHAGVPKVHIDPDSIAFFEPLNRDIFTRIGFQMLPIRSIHTSIGDNVDTYLERDVIERVGHLDKLARVLEAGYREKAMFSNVIMPDAAGRPALYKLRHMFRLYEEALEDAKAADANFEGHLMAVSDLRGLDPTKPIADQPDIDPSALDLNEISGPDAILACPAYSSSYVKDGLTASELTDPLGISDPTALIESIPEPTRKSLFLAKRLWGDEARFSLCYDNVKVTNGRLSAHIRLAFDAPVMESFIVFVRKVEDTADSHFTAGTEFDPDQKVAGFRSLWRKEGYLEEQLHDPARTISAPNIDNYRLMLDRRIQDYLLDKSDKFKDIKNRQLIAERIPEADSLRALEGAKAFVLRNLMLFLGQDDPSKYSDLIAGRSDFIRKQDSPLLALGVKKLINHLADAGPVGVVEDFSSFNLYLDMEYENYRRYAEMLGRTPAFDPERFMRSIALGGVKYKPFPTPAESIEEEHLYQQAEAERQAKASELNTLYLSLLNGKNERDSTSPCKPHSAVLSAYMMDYIVHAARPADGLGKSHAYIERSRKAFDEIVGVVKFIGPSGEPYRGYKNVVALPEDVIVLLIQKFGIGKGQLPQVETHAGGESPYEFGLAKWLYPNEFQRNALRKKDNYSIDLLVKAIRECETIGDVNARMASLLQNQQTAVTKVKELADSLREAQKKAPGILASIQSRKANIDGFVKQARAVIVDSDWLNEKEGTREKSRLRDKYRHAFQELGTERANAIMRAAEDFVKNEPAFQADWSEDSENIWQLYDLEKMEPSSAYRNSLETINNRTGELWRTYEQNPNIPDELTMYRINQLVYGAFRTLMDDAKLGHAGDNLVKFSDHGDISHGNLMAKYYVDRHDGNPPNPWLGIELIEGTRVGYEWLTWTEDIPALRLRLPPPEEAVTGNSQLGVPNDLLYDLRRIPAARAEWKRWIDELEAWKANPSERDYPSPVNLPK